MKILFAPAKQMVNDTDDFSYRNLPFYLQDTEILLKQLNRLSDAQLKKMWKCSDTLVNENKQRLKNMDLYEGLSPALFSYTGLAYKHMAANALTDQGLEYLEEHLRIISGFYGVLRPFDGIQPYRLEMQAIVPDIGDLYSFWQDKIYRQCVDEDHLLINLASKEYSRCVEPWLKKEDRMITCVFAQKDGDRIVQKGTLAKICRGEMVYWIAENQINDPEELKGFDVGCCFDETGSDETTYVFLIKE